MEDSPGSRDGSSTASTSLGATMLEIWRQALVEGRAVVDLIHEKHRVGRTGNLGLRTVAFSFGTAGIEGIEQNPNTNSRWAKLAQQGKQIMQFRLRGRYIANVCDGTLTRYPAWKALQLPE